MQVSIASNSDYVLLFLKGKVPGEVSDLIDTSFVQTSNTAPALGILQPSRHPELP